MESCHILRLPDELHVAVVKLLPGDALKATRATCRKLNSIASPYLYPVLYLSCHQLDLDVFRLVANNPLLIGGVKELVIDDTTLSSRLANWDVYKTVASYPQNWPDRKKAYCLEDDFEYEGRVWSDEPDKEFHALYKAVLKGHHINRRGHADISALEHALPFFKSLQSLIISNRTADDSEGIFKGAQSEKSSSPVVKMWRRLGVSKQERPPFPPRCDWVTPELKEEPEDKAQVMHPDWLHDELDILIEAYGLPAAKGQVHLTRTPDGRYPVAGNRWGYRRGPEFAWTNFNWLKRHYTFCRSIAREGRAISVALEVLGDPRIRLTEFRVDTSPRIGDFVDEVYPSCQPGLSVLLFDNNHSPLLPKLLPSFFSNLTKFHLVLSNCTEREGVFYIDQGFKILHQGHVTAILESLTQLEDLLLELHGMPIICALPCTRFKRLRNVEFSCGQMAPQGLLSFLRQHSGTLDNLVIEYCCIDPDIYDETWEDTMQEIRDMQDAGILNLGFGHGEVIGVYDHAPCRGCGKNSTLEIEDTGCPINSWEFIERSLWRHVDGYPWEFQDHEGSYVGRSFDTESEDGDSDEDGGDEDDEGEQESSGI
ncbi:hypothetical protein J7337_005082 [Fusarium musae]|uniref:F-box domain-containing protein n=1 Tax=Fusarium musae TaxID=1042133 RepID=A0A9P8DI20_9HYPO|nr:hypothetical protein J7337_005082 [Fusarium musae]KAG9502256.1 hypothetical protein J7337_005082 [Fusarium musae]